MEKLNEVKGRGKNYMKKCNQYRYIRKDTSTVIVAKKQVILEMLRVYRKKNGLHFLHSLCERGIRAHRPRTNTSFCNRWCIVIVHPKSTMATKKEQIEYDYFSIAEQITKDWRQS